jgi:uncharacterized protein
VIAVDTQILVYAHRRDSTWHTPARAAIAELAESGARWAIAMHCLVELYAKVTHPKLYRPASTPAQAIAQIDAWLESPSVEVLVESGHTWGATRDLLATSRVVGSPAYDARIAAVCLQHGVTELWTDDRDFASFPALRVRNPLIDIQPTRAGERREEYRATRRRAAPRTR